MSKSFSPLENIFIVVVFLILCHSAWAEKNYTAKITSDVASIEQIYPGACFSYDKDEDCDLLLIGTWDKKFYFSNCWDGVFSLCSNFYKERGASKEEALAYIRAHNYRWIGTLQVKEVWDE